MDGFAAPSGPAVTGPGTADLAHPGAGQIEALSDADLRALIVDLTRYAAALIRWYAGRLPRGGALPFGEDAGSLAVEAIARVLGGRRRPWDPSKEPSLLAYLKSVVKSIFTREVLPRAKRDPEVSGVDAEGNDIADETPASTPGPSAVDAEAEAERVKNALLALFDVEEDQLVLLCMMEEQTKAADIAATLEMPVRDVYRIKQKIKRRLETWRRGD